MDTPTCTFCSGATAVYVPTEQCRVCSACAKRIAKLAAHGLPRGVWDAPALPRDEAMDSLAHDVARALSPDDSESHYHLAAAYREMGLHADALREAAVALEHAPDEAKATAALRLLLMPPLLREDGLHELGAQLKRMMSN